MTIRKTETANVPIWRRSGLWIGLALLILLAALLRTAWISDDAYITLHTAQNIAAGHGPVFTPGERVQAYPHPLWMMALTTLYAVTHDGYYTVLIFQIALSLAVGVLLAREAKSTPAAVVGVLLLAASKAATDYGTSGLENPLSHLLLLGFILLLLRATDEGRRQHWTLHLWLLAALIALNRPALLLITLPALALLLWRDHSQPVLRAAALGMAPLILWGLFALIYYGTPISNPALARLSAAMPFSALLGNSLLYFGHSLWIDPLTMITIGLACVLAFIEPGSERRALAGGILLYLAAITATGAGFMSGRLFSAPFVGAVLLLVTSQAAVFDAEAWAALLDRASGRDFRARLGTPQVRAVFTRAVWAVVLLVLGFGVRNSPLWTGPRYVESNLYDRVVNERGGYYPCTGLFSATRLLPDPEARLARLDVEQAADLSPYCGLLDSVITLRATPEPLATFGAGLDLASADLPQSVSAGEEIEVGLTWRAHVLSAGNIGMMSYYIPQDTELVAPYALNDAFLARLPADPGSRIGRYVRFLPPGYLDTRMYDVPLIEDGGLSAFYNTLETVTAGPIFLPDRIQALITLNSGQLEPLLDPWGNWLDTAAEEGLIYQYWRAQGLSSASPDPASLQPTAGAVTLILLDPAGEIAVSISPPVTWTLPVQWFPDIETKQGIAIPTPDLPGTYTLALEVSVLRGENTISLPVDGDPGITRYVLGMVEVLPGEQ